MSTQECQRSRTLATKVYKAVNGITPNYIQELFEVKEIPYNLRDPTRLYGISFTSKKLLNLILQHMA